MSAPELNIERHFDAEVSDVMVGFLAIYDDPAQTWVIESRHDLAPGGYWELTFHPPGLAEFHEHRAISIADLPNRLEYTARVDSAGASFEHDVSIDLCDDGKGGTQFSLAQSGFPDAATRDQFAGAWPSVLDLVADALVG